MDIYTLITFPLIVALAAAYIPSEVTISSL